MTDVNQVHTGSDVVFTFQNNFQARFAIFTGSHIAEIQIELKRKKQHKGLKSFSQR